jgi:hypothetical protein
MPAFIENDLVLWLLKVYGVLFLLGPIVLRATSSSMRNSILRLCPRSRSHPRSSNS